ncbi:MAG TPA: DUF4438 domain-containing protein [Streptosporangiaceae bacterium]|nr:DUF4438 domain-containing protein [Streptosporangiaceae bacterium]
MSAQLDAVAVNLLGLVEHPELGDSPYRVDADGNSYVPAGDGGIVLGLALGDSVFALDGDHAAPGACLTHPGEAAMHALVLYSCAGNDAVVRTGAAAGARGAVIGKRGEAGRVITGFRPADLARMRPGDQVSVRGHGQGFRPGWVPETVAIMNLDPGLVTGLPVEAGSGKLTAGVRAVLPAKLSGNGLGRPAAGWDLDLQVRDGDGYDLRLGDLVAVEDIDARYNMGYRRGWVSVGIVVHGASPLPGHGPGMTPILTGPRSALVTRVDGEAHAGLTGALLQIQ